MINLTQIGTFNTGIEGAAEIPAYDSSSQRLFVVNAEEDVVDVFDLSDPSNPTPVFELVLTSGSPNSVAVYNGLVAVAVADNTETERGSVAFFDADGNFQSSVEVGALPDMLTFTPDGSKVLVANEGEPNDEYTVDPEGSISIINVETGEVTTASFEGFNEQKEALIADGVRIFGPDASVAQDLEPEYIAISTDGTTAFVTLQENNAFAVVDIASSTVTEIIPLGFKDYSLEENSLDPSDEDGGINLRTFDNLFGMYQPDAIASYEVDGQTYYITANEGDARDYDNFSEEVRVDDLELDPTAFPNAEELEQDEVLGRLRVTNTLGDTDGDGDLDELYSFGARSFSIWDSNGELVFDSGNELATITAELVPELFNSQGDEESFDSRSDDKGSEPEGVVTGVVDGKTYAFIGLERIGGIMVYDVSNPTDPEFVRYVRSEGDIAPEGLDFVAAEESPNGNPLLVVAYEISGSTTIYEIGNDTATDITPIYEIQGAAQTSPFVEVDFDNLPEDTLSITGETVTSTGVVTAVDSNGFYLQDPVGDGDIATSDAIFVFTSSDPDVTVGDALEVTGTVSEFFPGDTDTGNLPTTQISSPDITVVERDNELPAPVIIGLGGRIPPDDNIDDDAFAAYEPNCDGIDFFESLEAMRVTAQDTLAVAPTNRFGEIFTVVDRGASATGLSDRGTLNISPDDFNPEKVQIDEDSGVFDLDFPEVDTGALLGDVTGVVSYNFGNFEVIPTEEFSVTESDLEPEVSTITSIVDKLTVASYNVLNLDPNDDDGDEDIANGRFKAIANQIVNNLNSPNIIALQEIQDNSGSEDDGTVSADETLQLLVDEIAEVSGIDYEFIDNPFIGDGTSGGQPGGNIRNAFLYKKGSVTVDPDSIQTIAGEDQQTNPDNPFFDSRLPLVATFNFNGEDVTLVNNHFSSKGGSAPILGIEQPFEERQEDPTVNGSLEERRAQAAAVKDFVDSTLINNPNVVVLGDLNEFEFVSPVELLTESNSRINSLVDPGELPPALVNLTNTLPENERYTFIFQGNSQSLDHILVSENLAEDAEFDIVHVNAEFAENPERASDHEPLLASLYFGDAGETIIGTNKRDVLDGGDGNDSIEGGIGADTLNGGFGDDTLDGGSGGDLLNGSFNGAVPILDSIFPIEFNYGDDSLSGGFGRDTLNGGFGNDFLEGGFAPDNLDGGDGDDTLIGDRGRDLLTGGAGADTFVFNNTFAGRDIITDFTITEDAIDVSNITTGELFQSDTPLEDYVRLVQLGFDTVVRIDINGDLPTSLSRPVAILDNVTADDLTGDNFIFD